MTDMNKVTEPKSDQWNFDDFRSGPLTFTVESVRVKPGQEQPVEITLSGTPKFYRPCKGMSRVLVAAWGSDSKTYAGRSLTLFGNPTVRWGGMEVGGIQISHLSGLDAPMTIALTMTKQSRKPFTVRPLESVSTAQAASAATFDDPPIDEKQLSTITDLLNAHGVPEASFMAFGDLEATKDLPARLFDKACAWIKKQGASGKS